MIKASFIKKNGKFVNFRVSGHSGYSEQGSDIVCAAVSSMVMLVINTATEDFGVKASVIIEEENAVIDFTPDNADERAHLIISGLLRELKALENDFPKNVSVIVK